MLNLVKICVFVNLLYPTVITGKYLFKSGSVKCKRTEGPIVKQKLMFVEHIDQHLLPADALTLSVTTYYISDLYKGSVKNLPRLQKIAMVQCGIRHISPAAFQNLPNLEVINLSKNDLEAIEGGIFNYLPVKELKLQKNRISKIRSESFDNMPNLETIRLNGNLLKAWDNNWFRNTPKLTIISFKRNHIEELPENAFANLITSHEIDGMELVDVRIYLSNNSIKVVDPRALQGTDALDALWLDNNEIDRLDKNTFSHMTEMHDLNLRKNKLTEIDKNAFGSLSDMNVLDLRNNNLTCLPYEVAAMVSVVKLNHNRIDCDCLLYVEEKLKAHNVATELGTVEECVMIN